MALRTRLALFTAALALVAGGTSAASAASSFPGTLTITSLGNDQYNLVVSGYFDSYHPDGVDVAYRLWGDDEWFDDLLYSPPGLIHMALGVRHYQRAFSVAGSVLNEDWGADEIYADARLYDHRTGQLFETIKTNNLYGNWS